MNLSTHSTAGLANVAATDCLADWLTAPTTRNVMVATGNTPIELYRRISERGLKLSHLNVSALDECRSMNRATARTSCAVACNRRGPPRHARVPRGSGGGSPSREARLTGCVS